MKLLDIGEVSDRSGVKPSALRYYEEKGLIQSLSRNGLRRQYGPEVLQQLALIALGKQGGFALDEIAAMFGAKGQPELPRDELHSRADDMLRQAKQMEALAQMMRHVAECPEPNHLECARFQQMLRVAIRAQQREARASRSARMRQDS
ncbi:helix-turn-helix domain-containing protein [Epibacterium sp. Ofav1-8]|uniref:helix-turn-helix domain-containing protein n=1 Tax=Epibacterium sp. Ofav1-8 TaxID=2917735 RepID=UPI001EF66FB2|nr:helix-turn-helix domain-containing protein [Epibacterium sp. Ofav1-8]MCG7624063.1 helix-turn-helix domain-containing protein [Epibacterium sp. Ofav1-8]